MILLIRFGNGIRKTTAPRFVFHAQNPAYACAVGYKPDDFERCDDTY